MRYPYYSLWWKHYDGFFYGFAMRMSEVIRWRYTCDRRLRDIDYEIFSSRRVER